MYEASRPAPFVAARQDGHAPAARDQVLADGDRGRRLARPARGDRADGDDRLRQPLRFPQAMPIERAVEAVLAAVYLHGLAGDIARESMGEHSLVATDLVKALPEAFRRVRKQAAEKWVQISG